MVPGIFKVSIQSVRFNIKAVVNQLLITALLSAVITGSLMTGRSVKSSLKISASERLGNTVTVISSGTRFFSTSLAVRMVDSTNIYCTGLIELQGYSQSLISQKEAYNTNIYGLSSNFFTFHGYDSINIKPGEIIINRRLADYLETKTGDELIIRFNEISDIPSDAPFAPAKESGRSSAVFRIGNILEQSDMGNFSLSISQITPMNIFLNLSDLEEVSGKPGKINRLLISNNNFPVNQVYSSLKQALKPADIGISLRMVNKTGEYELISERVFIDQTIINQVATVFPSSAPVITYLANRFKAGERSTPYSFVSALPVSLYPQITSGNGIIINDWLAGDLNANEGDSLEMFWYSPDSLNSLTERNSKFIIMRIVDIQGIWSDSLLMPEFPGISGSESCSDWDAGVPIKMDDIRRKDEDYWNRYAGTPKAFINYTKGLEIWGNNYGPATSIRFPQGVSYEEIEKKLSGTLDPEKTGFIITDLLEESIKAANESVDFSTLFLSLGFFLILASVVLLSFAVSTYFDSKSGQINTLFALGFKSGWIKNLMFIESGFIALSGGFIGAFAGYLVNVFITMALNSVWRGAVQTDTLQPYFNIIPVLTGFAITIVTVTFLLAFKIRGYLKRLYSKEKEKPESHSPGRNLIFLVTAILISLGTFILSFVITDQEISLCFTSGTVLLIAFILFWRQYFIRPFTKRADGRNRGEGLSKLYYSFYPSNGITPILFIAAGIFAVFITGANRMDFSSKHLDRSGGTGGYLLWCENTIPVKEDLNSASGRKIMGLEEEQLNEMSFIQAKQSSGNDASCLNLNHITAPPLLGIDADSFVSNGSFSFSKSLKDKDIRNPWQFLNVISENNTIYGIADQTVLDWGLKVKIGDTLVLRAENGQPLNIVIAGGLKPSVFQGNVIIGLDNFTKYYPSVSGSNILLVDGNPELTEVYKNILKERLNNHGIYIESTNDRLASFYQVTNTYLSVFGVFGAFGMITGIAGLGFVLLRNFNHRKKEFSLMLATGFSPKKIKRVILSEQVLILFAGVISGVVSAIVATFPSVRNSPDIPWAYLIVMVFGIIFTGLVTLFFSARIVTTDSLTSNLKKD